MKYRALGRTGLEVSLLSFGCMRLPKDEEEAATLIAASVDKGINYFETSPGYCDGTSERKVGLGVKGRRDKVIVSTKSGVGAETTGDSLRAKVEASLEALGTGYLDFYQFWGFEWQWFDHARKPGGAIEAVGKLQDEGVIRHFGFTSHDTGENVIKLIDTGEFESATVDYHILNREKEEAIAHARRQGVGIVIMCPVAGGLLASPSKKLSGLFPAGGTSATNAELALRFVWSNSGVTTAASGMESLSDLEENVAAVERFEPVTQADRAQVLKVLDEFAALGHAFCTGCRYCLPCPNDVWIPGIFKLVNYARIYGLGDAARKQYWGEYPEKSRASACIECGECEPKCPHGIPIIAQLKEAAELLGDSGQSPSTPEEAGG
ncbi:MAG: aldo/keto reductase [Verrucomicrobia bacterium]|nr:aldo/keto reductase [Verrucomicrobiota bacterium]